jgi:hypothetical protein
LRDDRVNEAVSNPCQRVFLESTPGRIPKSHRFLSCFLPGDVRVHHARGHDYGAQSTSTMDEQRSRNYAMLQALAGAE